MASSILFIPNLSEWVECSHYTNAHKTWHVHCSMFNVHAVWIVVKMHANCMLVTILHWIDLLWNFARASPMINFKQKPNTNFICAIKLVRYTRIAKKCESVLFSPVFTWCVEWSMKNIISYIPCSAFELRSAMIFSVNCWAKSLTI